MTAERRTSAPVPTTPHPYARLRSRTVQLDDHVARSLDLLAFAGDDGVVFSREGLGLAGRGTALRIELPRGLQDRARVAETLSAIDTDDPLDRPGSGPVAFGALPFAPGEAGTLVVPEVLVARSGDGTAWCTRITSADPDNTADDASDGTPALPRPGLVADRAARWSPHDFDLRSCTPHEEWCRIIAKAVERIQAGELQKVVLARAIDVTASGPIVVGDVLRRLFALFPSCMVFGIDGFVGASPELLVSRKRDIIETHPLAGTVGRSGDPETDARLAAALLASPKDRWEHRLVIDFIDAVLRPLCDELHVPSEPSIVPLRNVSHLGTRIRGTLSAKSSWLCALDLVEQLHPTPAVGGTPTDRALEVMAASEPSPRGRYAGPVGWTDAAGNGEWAVGLRSAQIEGNRARMMAGGGIVADSDPLEELAETQLKFQALLAAIVRP